VIPVGDIVECISSRVCNFLGAQYRRAFAFVQFYRGRLCLKKVYFDSVFGHWSVGG